MIKKEDRCRPYPSHEFMKHLCGPRGKTYFPHASNLKERYEECLEYILNPQKSVIVPDKRESSNSTHICMFTNKAKENIAIPIGIDPEGKISLITLKNNAESKQKPDWFYDEYDKIASSRKMSLMNRTWRPQNEKY